MLTPDQIEENWNKFMSLLNKLGDRSDTIKSMLDEIGERFALCPASSKRDYHCAYPGGLLDHSLRVLQNLIVLNKTHGWKLPRESMIIAALFHDIGKIGMPGSGPEQELSYYLPQTDDWRRNKLGEEYEYNKNLQYMTTPDRSVFILQHYGIRLSPDEWLAIKLNDGFLLEANKPYCLKISPLVFGLQTADYMSTMFEKNDPVWSTSP